MAIDFPIKDPDEACSDYSVHAEKREQRGNSFDPPDNQQKSSPPSVKWQMSLTFHCMD